jgi:hypothetical protein
MGTHRSPRRSVLVVLFALAAGVLVLLPGPGEHRASADQPLTAHSVCEAQELKARKAENPDLQIVIPAEYDKPFPSLAACRSYAAASDPNAPGPLQPIAFSHKHHAGTYQIPCLYCHTGTDRSRYAGVPSVQVCMGCHSKFPAEYDELKGIQVLKTHWKEQKSIPWVRIYRVPDYVKFQHQAHIRAGFTCQTCHGPVEKLDKLYMVPDTKWWAWGLPTKKLEMGWCIQCHRQHGASQDCLTCHY